MSCGLYISLRFLKGLCILNRGWTVSSLQHYRKCVYSFNFKLKYTIIYLFLYFFYYAVATIFTSLKHENVSLILFLIAGCMYFAMFSSDFLILLKLLPWELLFVDTNYILYGPIIIIQTKYNLIDLRYE